MREWKFWDWVAYFCLFISAIIQAGMEKLLAANLFSSSYWSFAPLLLVILATLLLVARALGWLGGSSVVDTAELQLEIYSDNRTPTRISASNIWRWYYLQNIVVGLEKNKYNSGEMISTTLFLSFDKPVKVGTLTIQSNVLLPRHEVKEFNNRYAIIWFGGAIPASRLTALVH